MTSQKNLSDFYQLLSENQCSLISLKSSSIVYFKKDRTPISRSTLTSDRVVAVTESKVTLLYFRKNLCKLESLNNKTYRLYVAFSFSHIRSARFNDILRAVPF